jgi:hypothetical protein
LWLKRRELVILAPTIALDTAHVIWENATALMAIKALIVQRVFVQFYAQLMVIMVVVFVIVKMDGKDLNVTFLLLNVKIQLVQAMDDALKVNVIVIEVGKVLSVIKVSVINIKPLL